MNNAQFVSFVSSHDLDKLPAQTEFTCTWNIKNTGSTTWGIGYSVTHIHAESGSTPMTNTPKFALADVANRNTIAPGQTAVFTFTFTAPAPRSRRYFSDWQLQDPQGNLFGDILWFRVVTTAPVKTPSGFRESNAAFVADHTILDNSRIDAGQPFTKQWLVRNTGQRKWNDGYRLVFVSGDQNMVGSFSHTVPDAAPGEEVVISVDMIAPPARGAPYSSSWRLHDDHNVPFGDNLWVKIISAASPDGFNITPFSQNDPSWKNKQLGFGPRTLGEFGCLLTCYTMMLTGYGENLTPAAFNDRVMQLPQGRGFNGSDIFFAAPHNAFSHVSMAGNIIPSANSASWARWSAVDHNLLGRIDQTLAQGQAVIMQVDLDPADPYHFGTEQHWVLALARQGNDYLVVDPSDGQTVSLLTRFGSQTRRQSGDITLKNAIKSALFYRSSRGKLTAMSAIGGFDDGFDEFEQETAVPEGISQLGGEQLEALRYSGPHWPFVTSLTGVHDRTTGHPTPLDHRMALGHFDAVRVRSGISPSELRGYGAKFALCELVAENGRFSSPTDFARAVAPDIAPLLSAGVTHYDLLNQPNLSTNGLAARGNRGAWQDGAQFAGFFLKAKAELQSRFPDIKIGFPALAAGAEGVVQLGRERAFRADDQAFLQQASKAVKAADFLCLHVTYRNDAELETAVSSLKAARQQHPEKLLFITQFSNPQPGGSPKAKGEQAARFYDACRQIPGVGAAFYYAISGPGLDEVALRTENGRSTPVLTALTQR